MDSQGLFWMSSLIMLAFAIPDVLITSSVQQLPPAFRGQPALHE
jgi:hypothetical protein